MVYKGFVYKVEFFWGEVMASAATIETEKYSLLEDFNVDVEVDDEEYESFSLCFWVYLLNSTTFPSTIIRQVIFPRIQSKLLFIVSHGVC